MTELDKIKLEEGEYVFQEREGELWVGRSFDPHSQLEKVTDEMLSLNKTLNFLANCEIYEPTEEEKKIEDEIMHRFIEDIKKKNHERK